MPTPTAAVPSLVVPTSPLRLQYEVDMSPATTTSGRITILISSPDVPRVACDSIVIDVPIGNLEGDIFSRPPRIESNSRNWSLGTETKNALAPDPADKVTKYHRFTVRNQDPTGLVPLVPLEFKLIITGNVNTENLHTNRAKLVVSERSVIADGTIFPKEIDYRRKSFLLPKYESFLLFINSFYSVSPDTPQIPKSGFANGEPIQLSWESNGHFFELYQNDRLVYAGEKTTYRPRTIKRNNDGNSLDEQGEIIRGQGNNPISYDDEYLAENSARIVVISEGISVDTTFVLKAISISKAELYETLTLTVSNPNFSPSLVDTNLSPDVLRELENQKMPITTDTAHCLRIGDGTANGNIVLQALPDGNSGFVALNFNGYYSKGAEKRFNTSKSRWRLGTDQRGGNDQFFIDVYNTSIITVLTINANGNVGIGSNDPATSLDVRTGDTSAAITVGSKDATAGALYLGNPNHGMKRNYANGNDVGLYTTGGNVYLSSDGPGNPSHFVVTNSGNVGIGSNNPTQKLDVYGGLVVRAFGYIRNQGAHLQWNRSGYQGETWLLNQKGNGHPEAGIRFGSVTQNDVVTEFARFQDNGFFGIGITSPQVPLHVGTSNKSVSILASAGVVASGFDTNSDERLKTVVGRSDTTADLALLTKLHITDYLMRDHVQFGSQAFKKLIGQELEVVFPQAVHRHTGFVPDIYASATQVQRQGEALLLTLPTGLPQAATAGQRVKLIGPSGDLLATLAEAAETGSRQLLVSGANDLAATPNEVFVFGLEHPDVRSVDYEAVAMLNVSATQALARQVEDLHQQNAALNEQNLTQRTQLSELHAALQMLQTQVAALVGESVSAKAGRIQSQLE